MENEIRERKRCRVDQAAFSKHCIREGNYLFNLANSVYWVVGFTTNPNCSNRKIPVSPLHLVQSHYRKLII